MDYMKDRITEKRIENNLYKAVKCAEDFNRAFDFTPGSIKDLEDILDYYSEDIKIKALKEEQISNLSCIFGSYLGQVLLDQRYKKEGYVRSKNTKSSFPILKKDKVYISPIDKVYKRLILGPDENVQTYFQALINI
ncbi:MAG: hypothetical protein PUG67_00950 [Peptoniphilaceae bacterium]|nr:hypothetical protein [Peptoniphilaceae bacterium]MDY6018628.1 hypothetical protein [Anaerococcus sp.]